MQKLVKVVLEGSFLFCFFFRSLITEILREKNPDILK